MNILWENCTDFGVGLVSASAIDSDGINPATKQAMMLSLDMLSTKPDLVLIDAVTLEEVADSTESDYKR